jgi:hypothetical protein
MWEYRVSWTNRPPSWWDRAWRNGIGVRLVPETRIDTYWIIDGRDDLGVKRRGAHSSLEIKVRHERSQEWELWEKVIFQVWTTLESVRCAALLQIDPACALEAANPVQGLRTLLASAGLAWREHAVHKTRLQADAHALLANVPALSVNRNCLAELVHFRIDQRPQSAWSVCFESAVPAAVTGNDPGRTGFVGGYPELLSR